MVILIKVRFLKIVQRRIEQALIFLVCLNYNIVETIVFLHTESYYNIVDTYTCVYILMLATSLICVHPLLFFCHCMYCVPPLVATLNRGRPLL